ncbi:MAG: ABC transporter permease [Alkaliphilus sp.]
MTDSFYSNSLKSKYLLLSIALLMTLWYVVAVVVAKPIIIPTPIETLRAFIEIVRTEWFIIAVYSTVKRVLLAFSVTLISAITLGMVAGFYMPFNYLFKPIITVFKAVPTMAVIILAIIWLDSELAPILVSFLVTFPLIYQNVVHGIQNIDPHVIDMAKVYKVSKSKMIKDIFLPSIKSYLMAGISTAVGLNVRIIIAAEVLSQPEISIGTAFQIERANLNTAGVFAWSIIAIMIVGLFELSIKFLKKHAKRKVN